MKLYYIERTDTYGYDEYSDFVCWANSEDEARAMHPDGDMYVHKNDGWHQRFSNGRVEETKANYSGWTHDISALKVYELSRPPEKPAVVCASFHAG